MRESSMNEKELRYMKYIAEAGSIQKAAVLLQKNPSSLSRAVHRVEEDMDIILFKRTPEGLKPTPEGDVKIPDKFFGAPGEQTTVRIADD